MIIVGVTLHMQTSASCHSLNNGEGGGKQQLGMSLNLAAGKVRDLASPHKLLPRRLRREFQVTNSCHCATGDVFGAYEACIEDV